MREFTTLKKFILEYVPQHFISPVVSPTSTVTNHIFIGNEAADADSIISSLCCSYISYLECPDDCSHIPLVSVPRADFALRREVSILLKFADINIENLYSVDQLCSINGGCSQQRFLLTLLDHNLMSSSLQKAFQNYDHHVVQILDHHMDCMQYTDVKDNSRVIAFDDLSQTPLVGSTCTLVYEKSIKLFPLATFPHDVAWLLLGVILIDTLNMDARAMKGTERDKKAICELSSILNLTSQETDNFYKELINCKMDFSFWNELDCHNCLKYDFKSFHWGTVCVGFSSILLALPDFLKKANCVEIMKQYIDEMNLDILIIMSLVNKNSIPTRELLIVAKEETTAELLAKYLESPNNNLDLSEKIYLFDNSACDLSIIGYEQRNTTMSRKQLAPIVGSYYLANK